MDLQKLRSMRGNSDFNKIANALESEKKGGGRGTDDRFWKLETDKSGNGKATIRFLPAGDGDELPWVRIFTHGFQGPTGKWYIENSLTTIGQDDPVSESNSALWATGIDADKETARARKRRLNFYANILVVSDPKNPENEGKVFLFRFGKKIFDKIMDKANPTFEDEDPVNVFSPFDGADFKLVQRQVDGYPNYDQSVFLEPSALADGDEEEMVRILDQMHSLSELVDPSNFKSYDELKRKFELVIGEGGDTTPASRVASKDAAESMPSAEPKQKKEAKPKSEKSAPAKQETDDDDDDDDVMSYFANMAE